MTEEIKTNVEVEDATLKRMEDACMSALEGKYDLLGIHTSIESTSREWANKWNEFKHRPAACYLATKVLGNRK